MSTLNLLYQKEYAINDKIKVMIPTVGEILENEDDYYGLVSLLTAMPVDYMVLLDDVGVDFTTINEYELFLMVFGGFKTHDTSLVFGDLDMNAFDLAMNQQNGNVVLYDESNDIVIDRAIHGRIAATLRKIHHLEKNRRRPANKDAKDYMLQRAREKMKRNKYKKDDSELESLIIALVNTEQFKYDFEGAKGLSIYQFNESVKQIINKIDYDNRMHGVYAGTINAKDLSQDDFNWLIHK